VGQIVAGVLAKAAGLGWRMPYLLVAGLLALATIAMDALAADPPRGGVESTRNSARNSGGSGSDNGSQESGASTGSGSGSGSGLGALLQRTWSNLRADWAVLSAVPTNRLVYGQALFGTLPWAMITVFLPDFLAEEKGFAIGKSSLLILVFGIGAAVGGVLGGMLGSALYKQATALVAVGGAAAASPIHSNSNSNSSSGSAGGMGAASPDAAPLPLPRPAATAAAGAVAPSAAAPVPQATAAAAVPAGPVSRLLRRLGPAVVPLAFGCIQTSAALPMAWLVNMAPQAGESDAQAAKAAEAASKIQGSMPLPIIYAVAGIAGLLASMTGPNLKALLLNANRTDMRGSVFTFAYLFDSIAKGLGPYVIGLAVASAGGGGSAAGSNRAYVFTMALGGWLVSGLFILRIVRFAAQDEHKAREASSATAGAAGATAAPSSTSLSPSSAAHAKASGSSASTGVGAARLRARL
jgi:hypothetical protein